MLYYFFEILQKMLGVARPLGLATPTFIIEPILLLLNFSTLFLQICRYRAETVLVGGQVVVKDLFREIGRWRQERIPFRNALRSLVVAGRNGMWRRYEAGTFAYERPAEVHVVELHQR